MGAERTNIKPQTTHQQTQGFSRYEFNTLLDVDGVDLPLQWNKTPTDPQAKAAAAAGKAAVPGTQVRLRVLFRDATIYALAVGQRG
jgi:hypothetical protein